MGQVLDSAGFLSKRPNAIYVGFPLAFRLASNDESD